MDSASSLAASDVNSDDEFSISSRSSFTSQAEAVVPPLWNGSAPVYMSSTPRTMHSSSLYTENTPIEARWNGEARREAVSPRVLLESYSERLSSYSPRAPQVNRLMYAHLDLIL